MMTLHQKRSKNWERGHANGGTWRVFISKVEKEKHQTENPGKLMGRVEGNRKTNAQPFSYLES